MKIAIAIRLFSPEIGGVEGVTRSIASGLARSGHDVHVFTSEPNECALEGVTVHKVRGWQFSSIAKTLSFPYFAKKAIAQEEFDIVHAFSRMTGADIYRLADPPQAAHLHRNYKGFKSIFSKLSLRNRTILRLERDTYKNYQTTLVTNSYRTRRDLERYCEVDGSRVSVIRNGVDTERFHPSLREQHRALILNELNIPLDARVLLFVGNDFRRKGLVQTVQVFENLQQRMPDKPLHLIVVGLERNMTVRKGVEERDLSSTVHFMGRCKNSERFYGAADVFILPTREDPFANTILESLATGVPVITTRTNGAAELIESELQGAVVPSADDCNAMTGAAEKLLKQTDRKDIQNACRGLALQYSWDETVSHYEELYAVHLAKSTAKPANNRAGLHYLNPTLNTAFADSPDIFSEIMELAGDSKRFIDRRQTIRVEIENEAYFLKKHKGVGWSEIFKNLSSLKRPTLGARTEWEGIQTLEALGISTLSPVAFGERGINPAEIHSFLMTRELEGMVKLSLIREKFETLSEAQTTLIRSELIVAVAKVAKRFHQAGCVHSDFYLCHFMVIDRDWSQFKQGDALDLHLIDLHRMRQYSKIPASKQVKEIGALFYSATHLELTEVEKLLFIRNYSSADTNSLFWDKVCQRITHLVASKKRLLNKRPA
jgi:UDP-glucose:(heptosyl)LPS alpha-1,3-glucosyltransferase